VCGVCRVQGVGCRVCRGVVWGMYGLLEFVKCSAGCMEYGADAAGIDKERQRDFGRV